MELLLAHSDDGSPILERDPDTSSAAREASRVQQQPDGPAQPLLAVRGRARPPLHFPNTLAHPARLTASAADNYLTLGCVKRLLGDERQYVELGHYLLDKGYFFNEVHEAAFKAAYPKLHAQLFLGGQLLPKVLTSLASSSFDSGLRARGDLHAQFQQLPITVGASLQQLSDIKLFRTRLQAATRPTVSNAHQLMTNTVKVFPLANRLKLD